jgi:hypothetical protein
MSTHANMVKMTVTSVASAGVGTITLNAASSGYQSLGTAYGGNATVDILITEGTAWEVARNCAYTHSGTTVTRGTLEDSSTGSAVAFTSAAVVSVVATAGAANAAETVLTYADRAASYGFFVRNDGANTQTTSDAGWRVLHGGTGGALLTAEWNVGAVWSADANGKATLPEGRWLIGGSAGVDSLTTAERLLVGVLKNGEATPSRLLARCGAPNATATVCLSGSTAVESDGDDYFQLALYTDGAGTHVTALTAGFIYFWAQYLGPIL